MMQPSVARRAPVLRPVAVYATASHENTSLLESHSHTLTDSVFVLLREGLPLSVINTGSRYSDCSRLLKPPLFVNMDAVLSAKADMSYYINQTFVASSKFSCVIKHLLWSYIIKRLCSIKKNKCLQMNSLL